MPRTWNTDLARSKPIAAIVCISSPPLYLWGLNSAHIHGTDVPGKQEPSTASTADLLAAASNSDRDLLVATSLNRGDRDHH